MLYNWYVVLPGSTINGRTDRDPTDEDRAMTEADEGFIGRGTQRLA